MKQLVLQIYKIFWEKPTLTKIIHKIGLLPILFRTFVILNKKRRIVMARPIKETPVLKGKDAVRFAERLANPAPVSQSEKDAAREAYEVLKAISTFPM